EGNNQQNRAEAPGGVIRTKPIRQTNERSGNLFCLYAALFPMFLIARGYFVWHRSRLLIFGVAGDAPALQLRAMKFADDFFSAGEQHKAVRNIDGSVARFHADGPAVRSCVRDKVESRSNALLPHTNILPSFHPCCGGWGA